MSRVIGIRHRVKRTTEGEKRPTQVVIVDGENVVSYNLEDETAELDFVKGEFPVEFRKAVETDDLSQFREHQIKWRGLKEDEDPASLPQNLVQQLGKEDFRVAVSLPVKFDGLCAGDKVGMTLGGSGDYFAFALARRGEQIGATVHRIPPNVLKLHRGTRKKEQDAATLSEFLQAQPGLFYAVGARDKGLILLRSAQRARIDSMKARIACEQRLRQRVVGQVFCSPEGFFPEGDIEKQFLAIKANDRIFQALDAEESSRNRELAAACEALDVYQRLFAPIVGCGPALAARIISTVVDIRRFIAGPDYPRINGLRQQIAELKERAGYEGDLPNVAARITDATTNFQKCQMVRSWQRAHGQDEQAALLDQAVRLYQRIHRLKYHGKTGLRTAAKLKKYFGTHVLPDGRFPRRRNAEVANWAGDCRQALYLLADQFNKRPNSEWGKALRRNKAHFRQVHPVPIEVVIAEQLEVDGEFVVVEVSKKKYTDAHIHKMGIWRTLSQFTVWLALEWIRLFSAGGADAPALAALQLPADPDPDGLDDDADLALLLPDAVVEPPEATVQ